MEDTYPACPCHCIWPVGVFPGYGNLVRPVLDRFVVAYMDHHPEDMEMIFTNDN
jgi:hypothetical protein